ncbi:hypothetical protein DFH09DRAFT_925907, partial [Mycena vulgaris]
MKHPNVFCSGDFIPFFISCDAYPDITPGTTDHFPIISVIDLVPPTVEVTERRNWRATDWDELRKMAKTELAKEPMVRGYASVEEVLGGIAKLDAALMLCVEKHVPLRKVSPHSKRWWRAEFAGQKKAKDKLGRKSWALQDFPLDPAHELYRRARNDF